MSGLLGIGVSGLQAAQRVLDSIGHNIANASNPDYNKQSVEMVTRPGVKMGNGFVGTGVQTIGTKRMVDQFLLSSLRASISDNSELGKLSEMTSRISNLFASPETGIADGLNKYFTAMQDMNNQPASVSARQVFISQAQVLQSRFNEAYQLLDREQQTLSTQLNMLTDEVNQIVNNVAEINNKIVASGATNFANQPNDLLDRREALLKDLSDLISVTTLEQDDGSINIFIGNSQRAVVGGVVTELRAVKSPSDPSRTEIVSGAPGSEQYITPNVNGGKIGALLQFQDGVVTSVQNDIGRLSIVLAQTMNSQHKLGVDFNGNPGKDVFVDPNNLDAQLSRAISSTQNNGDAILSVSINPIDVSADGFSSINSLATNLMNVGTMSTLQLPSELTLNGIAIRPPVLSDDTVSSTDNTASAIAIANAINSNTFQHRVSAQAMPNSVFLGSFTPGAFAGSEFQINGINVVTTGADEATLLQDINALSSQTGVRAVGDGSLGISLVAADGRNVQLTSNTNTPVGTFSHFDTNSAVALDQVKRSEIKLTSASGPVDVGGLNPSTVGLTAITNNPGSLTTSDYSLSYDGNLFSLVRASDGAVVSQSATANMSVDGFTISLNSGTVAAGDSFAIRPTQKGALQIKMNPLSSSDIALGFPVAASANLENSSDATINVTRMVDTSGQPAGTSTRYGNAFTGSGTLNPPMRIEFVNENTYRVFDVSGGVPGVQIGSDQNYDPNQKHEIFPLGGVTDFTLPGPNPTYSFDPGFRVQISGTVAAGDVFDISFNSDAVNDNRNGLGLVGLQFMGLLDDKSSNYQSAFAQMIGDLGTQTAKASVSYDASTSLLSAIQTQRDSVSGVNIDEEAANLLKFEQSYQASAQIIKTARQIFDTLMTMVG